MKVLVVYESMFGNTKAIAEAIGEALAAEVVEVSDAPDVLPDDVGLLVVGAPTHAFSLSRPATRQSAAGGGGRQARADRLRHDRAPVHQDARSDRATPDGAGGQSG